MSAAYIVAGVDFGEPSIAAARWTARHLADGAEMVLAHAIHLVEPPSFLRALHRPIDQVIEDARRGADLRLREISESIGAARVWREVRVGRPADVLADVAAEFRAQLLVVGAHGERPGLGKLIGSTAERVARSAPTSLLLARALPPGPPRSILLALDESPFTASMIGHAAEFAAAGARVVTMHVVHPMLHGAIAMAAAEPERRRAEEQLRASAERWACLQLAGTPLANSAVQVVFGDPAFELLAAARRFDADLVVIGRHGGGKHRGVFFGSVVEFVLRNGGGSVLVVGG